MKRGLISYVFLLSVFFNSYFSHGRISSHVNCDVIINIIINIPVYVLKDDMQMCLWVKDDQSG